MIAYWLVITLLLAATGVSITGAHHARLAGHRGWYRFHACLTVGALVFIALFAIYAAPLVRGL